ncbi:MAG TPA: GDSL-type esterase/lipase family protein [Puia sp.]|nr:GDSL-type esterase/lipase family protein [Puia sp.]
MHSTLFLGDSYTIGEGLPLASSYPYQTIQLLRRGGYPFYAPELIARTGWTTDELLTAIGGTSLLPSYSFVSLLIGVNNQYRGRDTRDYAREFTELLRLALDLAGSPHQVFVLSIPDWGVSPFAAGRDRSQIARAIDDYNAVAHAICAKETTTFIDITTLSRTTGADSAAFVADGLHPARTTCAYWARELSAHITSRL